LGHLWNVPNSWCIPGEHFLNARKVIRSVRSRDRGRDRTRSRCNRGRLFLCWDNRTIFVPLGCASRIDTTITTLFTNYPFVNREELWRERTRNFTSYMGISMSKEQLLIAIHEFAIRDHAVIFH
jgi:hypothetical protein